MKNSFVHVLIPSRPGRERFIKYMAQYKKKNTNILRRKRKLLYLYDEAEGYISFCANIPFAYTGPVNLQLQRVIEAIQSTPGHVDKGVV